SLEEAIDHIAQYSSGHTESIITNNIQRAEQFQLWVDSSSVYVNLPTVFADGFEYGLGAEIGISTNRLHTRGPLGLEGLTTYKWVVHGNGQKRGYYERLVMSYLWYKVLHIVFFASWFAGLFYLPRIYVNMAQLSFGSEGYTLLLGMAKRLLRFMTIIAIV